MLDIPDEIGEEDQQRDAGAGEYQWREEQFSLRREQKPEQQCACKDRDGIFVFQCQAGDGTEHKPQLSVPCPDHVQNHIGTADPEERLERIHRELMVDDPPYCWRCGEQRGQ